PPPRRPPTSTLFPYTTLFRSDVSSICSNPLSTRTATRLPSSCFAMLPPVLHEPAAEGSCKAHASVRAARAARTRQVSLRRECFRRRSQSAQGGQLHPQEHAHCSAGCSACDPA